MVLINSFFNILNLKYINISSFSYKKKNSQVYTQELCKLNDRNHLNNSLDNNERFLKNKKNINKKLHKQHKLSGLV